MPLYQYRCQYCGIPFEELVSVSGPNPPCPRCGCPHTEKLMSACLSKTGGPDPVKRLLSQRAARRNGDPVGGSGTGGGEIGGRQRPEAETGGSRTAPTTESATRAVAESSSVGAHRDAPSS